jgi:hypothetical protein
LTQNNAAAMRNLTEGLAGVSRQCLEVTASAQLLQFRMLAVAYPDGHPAPNFSPVALPRGLGLAPIVVRIFELRMHGEITMLRF